MELPKRNNTLITSRAVGEKLVLPEKEKQAPVELRDLAENRRAFAWPLTYSLLRINFDFYSQFCYEQNVDRDVVAVMLDHAYLSGIGDMRVEEVQQWARTIFFIPEEVADKWVSWFSAFALVSRNKDGSVAGTYQPVPEVLSVSETASAGSRVISVTAFGLLSERFFLTYRTRPGLEFLCYDLTRVDTPGGHVMAVPEKKLLGIPISPDEEQ